MNNPLDLNKLFVGYFNKPLFRSIVVVIILLTLFTMHSNDWRNDFKAYDCPESSLLLQTECEMTQFR